MLAANKARILFRVPPPELTFAAGGEAPNRLFAIPPTTILSLQYPRGGAPRVWCRDVFAHQARESSPILAREPMSELPEDDPVHSAKDGRRIVSVSIEIRSPRECPVQAFHQVHAVHAVITRQFLAKLVREAPVLLPWNRRDRSQRTSWSPLANDAVAEEDNAVVHMGDRGLLHINAASSTPVEDSKALGGRRRCPWTSPVKAPPHHDRP
jgi:hypothetical protein